MPKKEVTEERIREIIKEELNNFKQDIGEIIIAASEYKNQPSKT
jgi:hypothetical protein